MEKKEFIHHFHSFLLLLTISSILYQGFLLSNSSKMDIRDEIQNSNEQIFLNYTQEKTLKVDIENEILIHGQIQPRDNEWTGFSFRINKNIPERAKVRIKWAFLDPIEMVTINIFDKTPVTSQQFMNEAWYINVTPLPLSPEWTEYYLKDFLLNNYQPTGNIINGVIDTSYGFEFSISFNPDYLISPLEINIYDLTFQWKNRQWSLLFFDLMILLYLIWFHFSNVLSLKHDDFYKFSIKTLWLIFFLVIIINLQNQDSENWSILSIPIIIFFIHILRMKSDMRFYSLYMFPLPFMVKFFLPDIPIFSTYALLIIFYLPVIQKNKYWKILYLICAGGFLVWQHQNWSFHYLFYSVLLLPLIMEWAYNLIAQNFLMVDQRKMASILYETVMDHSSEIILVTTANREVISYNKGFMDWLRLTERIPFKSRLIDLLPSEFPRDWIESKKSYQELALKNSGKRTLYSLKRYEITLFQKPAYQWFISDITELHKMKSNLEKANEELQKLAMTDSMTNLANRRRFEDIINQQWNICARTKFPVILAIADIDHFKQYNDHYGHRKGDEIIKEIALILKSAARRKEDLVARVGGEEFALLYPNAQVLSILKILESIMDDIRQHKMEHVKSSNGQIITISLGVYSMIPDGTRNWLELFEKADTLLYKAKQSGRDQIQWDSETMSI